MLFCGKILPLAELTIWDQTAYIPAGKLSVTKAKVTRLYQSFKPPLMHVLQVPNMEHRIHKTNGQFSDTRDIWLPLNFGGKVQSAEYRKQPVLHNRCIPFWRIYIRNVRWLLITIVNWRQLSLLKDGFLRQNFKRLWVYKFSQTSPLRSLYQRDGMGVSWRRTDRLSCRKR